jgi:bifunctional non-homologous end joining protein LigD
MPPGGPGWLHELKLDGVRFQVVKGGSQVRLYGRSGAEWTKRLPGFAAAFLDLRCRSAVLDGELVLPEEDGAPDSLQSVVSEAQEHELVFFAFDLLHRDGTDLRPLSFAERRRRLVRLVSRSEIPCLHLVQTFNDGHALLAAAERHGLEGIVSKRRAAAYTSGQSTDWLRIKTVVWRAANRAR